MGLVDGINHVAFVTNDLDRLSSFYERVFGVSGAAMPHGSGARHAIYRLGPGSVLHPFEFPDSEQTKAGEMFHRGRLDHIALNASSREAFDVVRERLVAEGASDGTVTDFGGVLSVFFRDPDGMEAEVCIFKEDASLLGSCHR